MSEDAKIAKIKFDDFISQMPVLEALLRRYVVALQLIAEEGSRDTPNGPGAIYSAVGHLNCRMIAKKALEP